MPSAKKRETSQPVSRASGLHDLFYVRRLVRTLPYTEYVRERCAEHGQMTEGAFIDACLHFGLDADVWATRLYDLAVAEAYRFMEDGGKMPPGGYYDLTVPADKEHPERDRGVSSYVRAEHNHLPTDDPHWQLEEERVRLFPVALYFRADATHRDVLKAVRTQMLAIMEVLKRNRGQRSPNKLKGRGDKNEQRSAYIYEQAWLGKSIREITHDLLPTVFGLRGVGDITEGYARKLLAEEEKLRGVPCPKRARG